MNPNMKTYSEVFISYTGWTALMLYLVGNAAYRLGKACTKSEFAKELREIRKYMKENSKENKEKKRWWKRS